MKALLKAVMLVWVFSFTLFGENVYASLELVKFGDQSYRDAVMADSPIAYWRMDEFQGASVGIDETGNGHDLSYPLSVSADSSVLIEGRSRKLSAHPIRAADDSAWDLQQFTLETWFKSKKTDSDAAFLIAHSASGSPYNWGLYESTSGRYSLYVRINGTVQVIGFERELAPVNQWHHLVGTYDGVTLKLYLNGRQVVERQISGTVSQNAGTIDLGEWSGGRFDGSIDEVAIYNYALSSQQISDHFANATLYRSDFTEKQRNDIDLYDLTVLRGGPVSYWSLDDNVTAVDLVSHYSGSIDNAPSKAEGIMGIENKALNFEKSANQHVVVPNQSLAHKLDQYSIEAWVKADEFGPYRAIFSKIPTDDLGVALRFSGDGQHFQFYQKGQSGSEFMLVDSDVFQLGKWYHIVATFSAGQAKLFVNGEVKAEGQFTLTPVTPELPILIGQHYYSTNHSHLNFDGTIDNVAFYDRVLTSQEATTHYQAGQSRLAEIFVEASSMDEAAINAKGVVVFGVDGQSSLFKLTGLRENFAKLFATDNTASVPTSLLDVLQNYFSEPTNIYTHGTPLYISYAVGSDWHAGGGPTGFIETTELTNFSLYTYYDNFYWYGGYYGPNWIKDASNNVYIFDNKTGNRVGNSDIHQSVYVSETKKVDFYMNYGGIHVVAVTSIPTAQHVTGGEYRANAMFEIPGTSQPVTTPVVWSETKKGSGISVSSEGLTVSKASGSWQTALASSAAYTGNVAWEVAITEGNIHYIGWISDDANLERAVHWANGATQVAGWRSTGQISTQFNEIQSGAVYSVGDILGFVYRAEAGVLEFWLNGQKRHTASGFSGALYPAWSAEGAASAIGRFSSVQYNYGSDVVLLSDQEDQDAPVEIDADPDNDGLSSQFEIAIGTDPDQPDTLTSSDTFVFVHTELESIGDIVAFDNKYYFLARKEGDSYLHQRLQFADTFFDTINEVSAVASRIRATTLYADDSWVYFNHGNGLVRYDGSVGVETFDTDGSYVSKDITSIDNTLIYGRSYGSGQGNFWYIFNRDLPLTSGHQFVRDYWVRNVYWGRGQAAVRFKGITYFFGTLAHSPNGKPAVYSTAKTDLYSINSKTDLQLVDTGIDNLMASNSHTAFMASNDAAVVVVVSNTGNYSISRDNTNWVTRSIDNYQFVTKRMVTDGIFFYAMVQHTSHGTFHIVRILANGEYQVKWDLAGATDFVDGSYQVLWHQLNMIDNHLVVVGTRTLDDDVSEGIVQAIPVLRESTSVSLTLDTEGSGSSILLDWSSHDSLADGITGYNVYIQSTDFASIEGLTPVATVSGKRHYLAENLPKSQASYFAVVPVDDEGTLYTDVTALSAIPVDTLAPEEVSNLAVMESNETSIHLRWSASIDSAKDLQGYRISIIQEDNSHTREETLLKSDLDPDLEFIEYHVSGLNMGVAYQVKVAVFDESDNYSEGMQIPALTWLANPQNVNVEALDKKLVVSWESAQPSNLVSHYNVYAESTPFTSVESLTPKYSAVAETLSQGIEGLENGVVYQIAVTVVNTAGAENTAVASSAGMPIGDTFGPTITSILWKDGIDTIDITSGGIVKREGQLEVQATDPSGINRVVFEKNAAPWGVDLSGSPHFEQPWHLVDDADGDYTIKITVFDNHNNATSHTLTLDVALLPPSQPSITLPASGLATNQEAVTVTGTAEPETIIQLQRNGVSIGSEFVVSSGGTFTNVVTLVDGMNELTAMARFENRFAFSQASAPVSITFDSSIPATPENLVTTARALGKVTLSWFEADDDTVLGYHVYRSNDPFVSVSEPGVARLTSSPLGTPNYQDVPIEDGTYYYAVTSVNGVDTESTLSTVSKVDADSQGPQALTIEYQPQGSFDSVTGRYGAGRLGVTITFNEPLRNTPFFALSTSGGLPLTASLVKDFSDPLVYKGEIEITPTTSSGVAVAVLSAFDSVGNRGTDVISGEEILIDTQAPKVTQLTVNPNAPIQNVLSPETDVEVEITLAEEVKAGTQPTLIPVLLENGISAPIVGLEAGIALTREAGAGQPRYTGQFTLPPNAGVDAGGLPNAELLSFTFEAFDDLDNRATHIQGNTSFQVYQGDLPPLDAPTGLTAQALPGGQVSLNWQAVPEAAGYLLHRQAPGETELTEWVQFDSGVTTAFLDGEPVPLDDGDYHYAIASLRSANGQNAVSAYSPVIIVPADGLAPAPPDNLIAELNGAGVVLRWQAPVAEPQNELLRYKVYRLDLPQGTEVIDLSGVEALQENIPEVIALDSTPSTTDHLYVVTAVDSAGNESAPSNSQYINVDLLPVKDLHIDMTVGQAPEIQWGHSSPGIAGFELATGPDGNLIPLMNVDGGVFSYVDSTYPGNATVAVERRYTVIAKDNQGMASLPHSLVLPAVSVALSPMNATPPIQKGIMNRVLFRVGNSGATLINQARLLVGIQVDGQTRLHPSAPFSVQPGGFADVNVVVGGYNSLDAIVNLNVSLLWQPNVGEQVTIQQPIGIEVGQSGLVARLEPEALIRGGLGKARLILENISDVETEILLAVNNGKADSPDVRFVLEDMDGNRLSTTAVRQVSGQVISVSDGSVVARIPAGETYLSDVFDMQVPASAPDDVVLKLEIDQFHYQVGRRNHVVIIGTTASQAVNLVETPYYGRLDSITPTRIYAGDPVTFQGVALDRETDVALIGVPLNLVLTSQGFERSYPVITRPDGTFSFNWVPTLAESGEYQVSVIHPQRLDRPDHGHFVVEGVTVSPTQLEVSIPRNFTQDIDLKVTTGVGTTLQNVHLKLVKAENASGQDVPLPEGVSWNDYTIAQVASGVTGYLKLQINGNNLAPERGYLTFDVVADNLGQTLATIRAEYFFAEALPVPKVSPSFITTGTRRGGNQSEVFTLRNEGLAPISNAHLTLVNEDDTAAPDWIRLAGTSILGDIGVNESRDIHVLVTPDTGASNGDYRFKVMIQGDNIPAQPYYVAVAVTDATTGSVVFHTRDIYTATLDEQGNPIPGLGQVSLKLQNEEVLSAVFEVQSDQNGDAVLDNIPTGSYFFRASAFDHETVTGRLLVKPGTTTYEGVFLMNKLVTVEFSVREITLQDRYEIVLESTFETNVLAPVIIYEPAAVNLPLMEKGQVFYGELTLTNYGLLQADTVTTQYPKGDEFTRFEFLADTPETLGPGEFVVIPYRVIALQNFDPGLDGNATGGGCVNLQYQVKTDCTAVCLGGDTTTTSSSSTFSVKGGSSCGGSGGGFGGGYGFYGGFGGSGGGVSLIPKGPDTLEDNEECETYGCDSASCACPEGSAD